MKFSLIGKKALVTGGGSGIGKAISLALSEYGAIVHVLDLQIDQAKGVVDEIIQNGGEAYSHEGNVADQTMLSKVLKPIIEDGGIDILINNAGISHIGNIENTTELDMDRLYYVNIKGVYNCIHLIIPSMKEKGGVILNIASIASFVGLSDRFAYSMSKGAVLTMTYSVAKDYIDHGIRCNSISPARIHTPFVDDFIQKNYPGKEEEIFEKLSRSQPIGRMGKPEEVANLALYLCSNEASFITGSDFPIDGGFIKLNN